MFISPLQITCMNLLHVHIQGYIGIHYRLHVTCGAGPIQRLYCPSGVQSGTLWRRNGLGTGGHV